MFLSKVSLSFSCVFTTEGMELEYIPKLTMYSSQKNPVSFHYNQPDFSACLYFRFSYFTLTLHRKA